MGALPRAQQVRIQAHDPGDPLRRVPGSNPTTQRGRRPTA